MNDQLLARIVLSLKRSGYPGERLLAFRQRTNPRPDMNGNPADVATRELDFAGVHSSAYENAKVSRHLLNAQRTAHRTSRSIERRKEPIAGCIYLAAAERG